MKISRLILFQIILLLVKNTKVLLAEQSSPLISYLIKAEELTNWKLYEDAFPFYQKAINESFENKDSVKESIKIRMVEGFLKNRQYKNALESLNEIEITSVEFKDWVVFLKSTTLRHLKEFYLAEQVILNHFSSTSQTNEFLLLELAIILFEKKEYSEALVKLDYIKSKFPMSKIQILADIYYVKIAHIQEKYQLAQDILAKMVLNNKMYDSFFVEISILKGINAFFLKNYFDAILNFEDAINCENCNSEKEISEVITNLINSYIELYKNKSNYQNIPSDRLQKGEIFLESLQKQNYTDENCIALAELFLLKFNNLNDEEAKKKCIRVLDTASEKIKSKALLIRAQLATKPEEREFFLKSIVELKSEKDECFATAWILMALNKKETEQINSQHESFNSRHYLMKAIKHIAETSISDEKIIQLLVETTIKFQEIEELNMVYSLINSLIKSKVMLSKNLYLSAQIASNIYQLNGEESFLEAGIRDLKSSVGLNLDFKEMNLNFLLLGKLQILIGDREEAITTFHLILKQNPDLNLVSETLFWLAKIEKSKEEKQKLYKRIYLEDPNSIFAAEACFSIFEQEQYIQGEKEAIQHLKTFIKTFSKSPFTLNALYLLGLDLKRNRKNAKGKWISKKNLIQSIDNFQKLEFLYLYLNNNNDFSQEQKTYYRGLYYRAILERGSANHMIGIESFEAKKQIYIKYAEEVFKSLISIIEQNNDSNLFQNLFFESHVRLASSLIESNNLIEAEIILNTLIIKSREMGITKGYYLSRGWNLLGTIDFMQKKFSLALEKFNEAEETSKGRVLNTDQKLEQWIQISECYKNLNEYDQAMSQLSKIINADVISALRIKAMVLRSEIYTLQGRSELARKQLEAAALRGGEWGKKAKEQLVKDYEYH